MPNSSSSKAPSSEASASDASSSGTSLSEVSTSSSSQSEASPQKPSAPAREESATRSKAADLVGYVKGDTYGMYSKIVSCFIENDVMTVVFSAYAESTVNANVFMDVWMSDDNGAGEVYETYAINELKKHSISISSFWFDENHRKRSIYEVRLIIGTTTHRFYFNDGEMFF